MDPNETLKEMLEIAQQFVICPEGIQSEYGQHDGCACASKMERMGELVLALHDWLRRDDGILPDAWAVPDEKLPKVLREGLIKLRDECLGAKQPGAMDPVGAVILSHAIRYLGLMDEVCCNSRNFGGAY